MDVLPRNPDLGTLLTLASLQDMLIQSIDYVNPEIHLNAGIWSLYVGATGFLIARLYSKTIRRHRLWYDDYILILAWVLEV